MPISGATRHDATVAVSPAVEIGVHHVVALKVDGAPDTLYQHPTIGSSGILEKSTSSSATNIYGVAVTRYLPQPKAPSTTNPVCVVAVSGPVTVQVKYDTDSASLQLSKTKRARDYVGSRGLVLQDTMNTTNGVDVILYDSRGLISALFS